MARPTPGLQKLVERQVKTWQARQMLEREQERLIETRHPHGPWIAVSRQLGSGGAAIAEGLSRHLGWAVFDREIIARIASEMHTVPDVVRLHDEHAARVFDDYLTRLVIPDDRGQAAYLQEMTRVVGDIARHGRAIILGRGANWFLNRKYGLRVRVVAPLEQRVARVAGERGIDPGEARREVLRNDADQRRFIRQAFRRDVEDPLGYDLVVNSGGIDNDEAIGILTAAVRQRFPDVERAQAG